MKSRIAIALLLASLLSGGFSVPGAAQASRGAPAVGPTPEAVDPELRALVKQAALETDSFHDRFDGEVWLADMSQRLEKRVPDPAFRIELLKNVHYEARRADLPPELVLAVIEVESNFSQYAISVAGARGLMQVMPFWLKEIGKPGDSLFRVQTNLRFGCTILKYYLQKEKGNLHAALKRYNGTRESKYSFKVDKAYKTRWFPQ
ncbi:MAG: transglycosylase SLT domain-containing protein [Pseudomonadota bacterium]